MAQLSKEVRVKVTLDLSDVRRSVKRILALAGEANRELARLEEQYGPLAEMRDELAEYGIRLEVKDS